jgi:hypothetical protein
MPTVLTASLVVSPTEAYLAYSDERRKLGPNGEPRIARILHTIDAGAVWRELPWVRTLLSKIRHPGYPTWPPEMVQRLVVRDGRLVITHRDEWVPYEPGGESLWESTLDRGEWQTVHIRLMRYDDHDPASPKVRSVQSLPSNFRSPSAH